MAVLKTKFNLGDKVWKINPDTEPVQGQEYGAGMHRETESDFERRMDLTRDVEDDMRAELERALDEVGA